MSCLGFCIELDLVSLVSEKVTRGGGGARHLTVSGKKAVIKMLFYFISVPML